MANSSKNEKSDNMKGRNKYIITFGETIANENGEITIPPEKSATCRDSGSYMDIALVENNERYNKQVAIEARKAKEPVKTGKVARAKTVNKEDGISI